MCHGTVFCEIRVFYVTIIRLLILAQLIEISRIKDLKDSSDVPGTSIAMFSEIRSCGYIYDTIQRIIEISYSFVVYISCSKNISYSFFLNFLFV